MLKSNEAPALTPRPSGTLRIAELEGLRGILAWCVVAIHLLLCNGVYEGLARRYTWLTELGLSLIDVFILLSGFVIMLLLSTTRERYGEFMWRRACRILPAYWVALFCGILLNDLLADNFRRLPAESDVGFYIWICELGAQRLWLDAPLHVFMLHGLFPASVLPAAPYTLLGVGWSLAVEWQFYCIAPFVLTRLRQPVVLAVVVLACAIATWYSEQIIATFSYAFLPARMGFFLVGAMTYVAWQADNRRSWTCWLVLPSAGLSLLLLGGPGRRLEAFLPLLIWAVVIANARFQISRPLRSFLNSRPLQAAGRWSYGTYLFHVPVIALVQAAIWRWVRPESLLELSIWTTAASIPPILLVSGACWRWIEAPLQRLGRLTRPAAARAATLTAV